MDAFGVIQHLQSGCVIQVADIRIAAVGGAPEAEGYDDERTVSEAACEMLVEAEDQPADVLMSHASPKGVGGASNTWGSERVRTVIELCQPAYHFYAHH